MNSNDPVPIPETSAPPAIPVAQPLVAEPVFPPRPSVPRRIAFSLWHFVLPMLFMSSLCVLLAYLAPYLLVHWKMMDAHTEVEISYLRRRAELKAEAEHADARLELLDKKAHLTSLGFQDLARKVTPLVINVVNYRVPTAEDKKRVQAGQLNLVYDPDNDRHYVQQSVGSGLIYKPGIILTNDHVIRGLEKKKADRLRVSFPSGRSIGVDGDAATGDSRTDLAVIRLPEKLPAGLKEEANNSVEFADSDKVHVGEWVLAMGSPLGLRHTMSHGIISAKNRLVLTRTSKQSDDAMEFLQTDAPIFPGNSGGPLFDQLGRVVGINTMIAAETGDNQRIGFAIPSNTAKRVAELLLDKGEVPRALLGITMGGFSAQQAKKLKLDGGGILISTVRADGGAEKAGLKPGDVIVRINKDVIQSHRPTSHMRQILGDLDPGAEIIVEVVRGEERREFKLTLGR